MTSNTMLTQYDHAMSALSTALNSKSVTVVLQSRDDLKLLKYRARQVRDRQLLADATEFQMRVERWLGELLNLARDAGQLHPPGRPNTGLGLPTLRDIGVDRRLSVQARQSAALKPEAFDAAVADMRSRIASGKAKTVSSSPVMKSKARRAEQSEKTSFDHQLVDGVRLGQVRIGTLRSRIERLKVELKILEALNSRVGSASSMATIEESVSDEALASIIEIAEEI